MLIECVDMLLMAIVGAKCFISIYCFSLFLWYIMSLNSSVLLWWYWYTVMVYSLNQQSDCVGCFFNECSPSSFSVSLFPFRTIHIYIYVCMYVFIVCGFVQLTIFRCNTTNVCKSVQCNVFVHFLLSYYFC